MDGVLVGGRVHECYERAAVAVGLDFEAGADVVPWYGGYVVCWRES